MFNTINYKYYLIVFSILLVACTSQDEPQPVENPEDKLIVNFAASAVPFDKVDSVILISGSSPEFRLKFQKGDNKFSLNNVPEQRWNLEIYLKEEGNQKIYRKDLWDDNNREKLIFEAPANDIDEEWLPRMIFRHPEARLIIGLSPLDPYFELQVESGKFNYFYISKEIFNRNGSNSNYVTGATQEKYTNIKSFTNQELFASLASYYQLPWNQVEVYALLLKKDSQEELTFFYLAK